MESLNGIGGERVINTSSYRGHVVVFEIAVFEAQQIQQHRVIYTYANDTWILMYAYNPSDVENQLLVETIRNITA